MKILHIVSSPRGEASFSIKLGKAIIDKLLVAHPGSTVNTRNIAAQALPHLEEAHIQSFFTPAEQQSPAMVEAARHSDDAIAEVMDADAIVIGVPMYNFSIHSALKTWIDHIARAGLTFSYSEAGAEGLVKNKKVYLAIATGAVYTEGPWQAFDFTETYLRTMLSFLGMKDITVFRVEGVNMPVVKDTALDKAVNSIEV